MSKSAKKQKERDINRVIFDIVKRAEEKKKINSQLSAEEVSNMILINIRSIVFDWYKFNGQYDLVAQIRNNMSVFVKGII